MAGPYRAEYKKAMQKEIDELTEHNIWTLVPRNTVPEGVTILPSTWAFKIKHYPDRYLRNLKTGFKQEMINKLKDLIILTNMS